MAKYGIPATQLDDYRASVQWNALKLRGDLSIPTAHPATAITEPSRPRRNRSRLCAAGHAQFSQLYGRSVHQPLFSVASGGGGRIVCHSNHAIYQPSTAMLVGSQTVCSQCHEPETPGGQKAAQVAKYLDGLDSALKQSEAVLTRAVRDGGFRSAGAVGRRP
jgi:hypothetical protein